MTLPFELSMDTLRNKRGIKWGKYPADVIPAWVAEMDFTVAHPIGRAIAETVREQEFGYPQREGRATEAVLADAFAARMQERFGWAADPALVQPLSDLVQGTFAAVWAFSDPGDGVILQLPAYPPFHMAIHDTGRRLIDHHLRSDGERFVQDLDALAAQVDARTRIFLLCNPQNPTGRAFTRAELQAIADFAAARDLIILSDEIHADLVHDDHAHIPIAALGPEVAARTVTITSATKSFNIPGLSCGVMHFGTPELQQRFHARIPHRMLGHPSVIGVDATVAAWRHGQAWLDEVKPHLARMRDKVDAFLTAELPALRWHKPESTYLGWIDCTALNLPGTAHDFFLERARVGFSPGEAFDPEGGRGFARINFATSPRILDMILERMAEAVRSHNRG